MQGIYFMTPIIIIFLVLFLYFVPLGLWIQSGVSIGWGKVGMIKLVIMRIRKIPPKLVTDGTQGVAVLLEPAEVVAAGGNGIDKEIRLRLCVVKEEGLVEIEIDLLWIQHSKDDDLVTCSGQLAELPF